MKTHIVGSPYYYNCKECGKEMWTPEERESGICESCLTKWFKAKMGKLIWVKLPTVNARMN